MNKKKQYPEVNTILLLKENNAHYIHSRLEPLIKVNGEVASVMVMVNKFGLMVLVMKETGKIIELRVKENSFILMEMYMKATG